MIQLHQGDALAVLATMPAESIDSIVTDPPYGLSKEPDVAEVLRHWLSGDDYEHGGGGFMGKSWDSFVPGPSVWKECLRVLKPGGHLLCFAGSRTVDLMGMAIRLAGFEIRDQLQWLYGSGFPKSLSVHKATVKAVESRYGSARCTCLDGGAGVLVGDDAGRRGGDEDRPERDGGVPPTEGAGWRAAMAAVCSWCGLPDPAWLMSLEPLGTALKPAHEPIILARKPFKGTVAKNVLEHGTGALNIDATRIGTEARYNPPAANVAGGNALMMGVYGMPQNVEGRIAVGRWPANVILDPEAGALLDEQTGTLTSKSGSPRSGRRGDGWGMSHVGAEYDDRGGASRFFYCAKTAKSERNAGLPDGMKNDHPTVKPVALMEWLVKMVTPPGGTVLDPFCGSGTTMVAAERLGFDGIGIDRDDEDKYLAIARHRVRHASELEYEAGRPTPPPPPAPSPAPVDDSGVLDLFPDL